VRDDDYGSPPPPPPSAPPPTSPSVAQGTPSPAGADGAVQDLHATRRADPLDDVPPPPPTPSVGAAPAGGLDLFSEAGDEDDAAPKGEGDSDEEGADDLHEEAMRNTASKFQRPPPLPKDEDLLAEGDPDRDEDPTLQSSTDRRRPPQDPEADEEDYSDQEGVDDEAMKNTTSKFGRPPTLPTDDELRAAGDEGPEPQALEAGSAPEPPPDHTLPPEPQVPDARALMDAAISQRQEEAARRAAEEAQFWPADTVEPATANQTSVSFYKGDYNDERDSARPEPGRGAPPPTPFFADPSYGYDMGGATGAAGAPLTRGAKEAYLVQRKLASSKMQRDALDQLREWDNWGQGRFSAAQAVKLVQNLEDDFGTPPPAKPSYPMSDFVSCPCLIWVAIAVLLVWAPLLMTARLSREMRALPTGVLLASSLASMPASTAAMATRGHFLELPTMPEAKLRSIRDCTFVHRGSQHALRVASLVRKATGDIKITAADGSWLTIQGNGSAPVLFSRPFQGLQHVEIAQVGEAKCHFADVTEAPKRDILITSGEMGQGLSG